MSSIKRSAAAALAVLALSGCAGRAALQEAGAPAVTAQDTYDRIVRDVYGTAEQRTAATEAGWLRTQIAVAECMAGHGQRYVPAPFTGAADTGVAPGDLLGFAPARGDFGYGRTVVTQASAGEFAQPAVVGADDARNAAFTEALNVCGNGSQDGGYPEGQDILDGLLVGVLAEVEKAALPELARSYKECLAGAGTPAENLSDLYVKATLKYPPVSYERPSDPTTLEGWNAAVAYEARSAKADADCRAGAVDTALVAAAPALEEFARVHFGKLETVAAAWAKASGDLPALRAKAATYRD